MGRKPDDVSEGYPETVSGFSQRAVVFAAKRAAASTAAGFKAEACISRRCLILENVEVGQSIRGDMPEWHGAPAACGNLKYVAICG